MIKFHQPYGLLESQKYLIDVLENGRTEGDGKYTKLCQSWLQQTLHKQNVLLMTSGTHALECACHCLKLSSTDEVILPSYNFPSAANAVLLAGGKIVFSEVENQRLTLDPKYIEEKISPNTKAIIVVHYGGFLADMDTIMDIARRYKLQVIEDAAQSFMNPTQRKLDQIGDFICYSFHGTKDIISGEGGALYVKDNAQYNYAKRFRQKGTNRDDFLQGSVAFYEWTNLGSSYSPPELSMALLYSQLKMSRHIVEQNRGIFRCYQEFFEKKRYPYIRFSREQVPHQTNGHTFYIIFEDALLANEFKAFMASKAIEVRTHFVPLVNSSMAQEQLNVVALKNYLEDGLGQALVRLPIYPDLDSARVSRILKQCEIFFGGSI